MNVQIVPVPLGVTTAYLLKGDSCLFIEGGPPGQLKSFLKGLERASVKPGDIEFMLITHGHWDHIGSARAIKGVTGARLAMHEREKAWLENSLYVVPPGVTPWGRALSGLMSLLSPYVKIPSTTVDLVLTDKEYSLKELGIPGIIVATSGHSVGSVSLLLVSGEAFVGDLAMNALPMRATPGLPIFADDMDQVKESWRKLFDRGVKRIFPAHGKPFDARMMEKFI